MADNSLIGLVVLIALAVYIGVTSAVIPRVVHWITITELFRLRSELYALAIKSPNLYASPVYRCFEAGMSLRIGLLRQTRTAQESWKLAIAIFQAENAAKRRKIAEVEAKPVARGALRKLFPQGGEQHCEALLETYEASSVTMAWSVIFGNPRTAPLTVTFIPAAIVLLIAIIVGLLVSIGIAKKVNDVRVRTVAMIEADRRLAQFAT